MNASRRHGIEVVGYLLRPTNNADVTYADDDFKEDDYDNNGHADNDEDDEM